VILLIASDLVFGERLRRDLRGRGIEARLASSWSIGVQLAGIELPDLVVVDETQVDLDGLSVLALLKAHPTTAAIPVLLAADRDRRELRRRADHLGALETTLKAELSAERLSAYLRSAVEALTVPAGLAAPASSPIPRWRPHRPA
jgi:DNA-binding response OmpR family regulator